MQYCNHEWFAITGHAVVDFGDVDWHECIAEEDHGVIDGHWDIVVEQKKAVKFQFRLRRIWSNEQGGHGQAWVMASVYPELGEDGSILAVAGTLTDISHLKWAESAQKRRTEEAIEAKRQQENFIDMTSHEIRNPLGAVIHCADMVQSTLTEMTDILGASMSCLSLEQQTRVNDLRDGSVEAVNTIISCSKHQRRLLDDILTLSKLDSRLLTIVPSPVRLDDILKDTAKMFEVDSQKANVTLRVARAQSFGSLAVDWVMLDAGRLMQALINLITNALKFTQKEAVRIITLSSGASRSRLSEHELDVDFVPVSNLRKPGNSGTEWGAGEEVFLYFKVSDTGCGFSPEQKVTIFERFAQATPKTHATYGGSGLGLFITRELIELQVSCPSLLSSRFDC